MIVETATGKMLDLSKTAELNINIDDIVLGLANINRFNGRHKDGERPITVLEHSYAMYLYMRYLNEEGPSQTGLIPCYADPLAGLIHDAAEAFIGDIITPVKNLCPDVKTLENTILCHLHDALHIQTAGVVASYDALLMAFEYEHYVARNAEESRKYYNNIPVTVDTEIALARIYKEVRSMSKAHLIVAVSHLLYKQAYDTTLLDRPICRHYIVSDSPVVLGKNGHGWDKESPCNYMNQITNAMCMNDTYSVVVATDAPDFILSWRKEIKSGFSKGFEMHVLDKTSTNTLGLVEITYNPNINLVVPVVYNPRTWDMVDSKRLLISTARFELLKDDAESLLDKVFTQCPYVKDLTEEIDLLESGEHRILRIVQENRQPLHYSEIDSYLHNCKELSGKIAIELNPEKDLVTIYKI